MKDQSFLFSSFLNNIIRDLKVHSQIYFERIVGKSIENVNYCIKCIELNGEEILLRNFSLFYNRNKMLKVNER